MRLLIALVLVAACTEEVVISEDQACGAFAKAFCGQIQKCSAAVMRITFGDQATCETRLKPSCITRLKNPGTTLTTNRLDACAQKFMAQTCADSSNHVVPEECKPLMGALADGTPCGDDGQCKSAYCKKAGGATCGVCATMGTTCAANTDCPSGLVCANQTCVMNGAMGATCDAGHPCSYGLKCISGTCQTPPGLGQMCMPSTTGGTCDQSQGHICNLSSVCQEVGYGKAGEACGFVNSTYVVCEKSGRCTSMLMGNCLAAAADGAACNVQDGPDCLPPAQCVNSVCTLPDTSTCK
jgi:hypothetical protein